MPTSASEAATTVQLVEEQLRVDKKTTETGRVRVRSVVEERQLWVDDTLVHEEAVVERTPIGQEVDAWPEPRWEGEVYVIPVVEEVVVAHKALMLVEEVRVSRRRREEPVQEPVVLRRTRAVVERD